MKLNKTKTRSLIAGLALLLAGVLTGQTQVVQSGFATLIGGAVLTDEQ